MVGPEFDHHLEQLTLAEQRSRHGRQDQLIHRVPGVLRDGGPDLDRRHRQGGVARQVCVARRVVDRCWGQLLVEPGRHPERLHLGDQGGGRTEGRPPQQMPDRIRADHVRHGLPDSGRRGGWKRRCGDDGGAGLDRGRCCFRGRLDRRFHGRLGCRLGGGLRAPGGLGHCPDGGRAAGGKAQAEHRQQGPAGRRRDRTDSSRAESVDSVRAESVDGVRVESVDGVRVESVDSIRLRRVDRGERRHRHLLAGAKVT